MSLAASASWKARVVCWTVRTRSRAATPSPRAAPRRAAGRRASRRRGAGARRRRRSAPQMRLPIRAPPARRAGRRPERRSARREDRARRAARRGAPGDGRPRRSSRRRRPASWRPRGRAPPEAPAIAITRPSRSLIAGILPELSPEGVPGSRQGRRSTAPAWCCRGWWSTCHRRERWAVLISTRGGNQSWTGLVKYFDPARCDYLFVHVGDGRRWFIPDRKLESSRASTWVGRNTPSSRWSPAGPWHRTMRHRS